MLFVFSKELAGNVWPLFLLEEPRNRTITPHKHNCKQTWQKICLEDGRKYAWRMRIQIILGPNKGQNKEKNYKFQKSSSHEPPARMH